ncbi:MAG: hypothetical protein ACYS80_05825 [Planctomycetota bacterium]|jgi:hypothetical protein
MARESAEVASRKIAAVKKKAKWFRTHLYPFHHPLINLGPGFGQQANMIRVA